MLKIYCLTLFATAIFCNACTPAQTKEVDHSYNEFVQQKITDHLYVIKASGYNTNAGVFIGTHGIVLIDPMTGFDNHQNLLNKIRTLSDKPVQYVLNTHSHGDHSGANKFFADLGATIISHKNAIYSNALYDVTFDDTYTLELDSETITLKHITAHTIDDALIYFTNSNVLFMGDTYMSNSYPHYYYGGGGSGHLHILSEALAISDNRTVIVPAHGDLSSNKAALLTYKNNSIRWIDRIKALHTQGKTTQEIVEDDQIRALSVTFTGEAHTSGSRLSQTIEKSISADLIESIVLPTKTLSVYKGKYQYNNNKTDELIVLNEQLFLRSSDYMYGLTPLSKTKFHVRGQVPHRHITFEQDGSELTYFDGKANITAKKL